MTDQFTAAERRAVRQALLRASGQSWGMACGLLLGFGLLLATVVLVIKDGPNPGPHLSLLRVYFPGYSITWTGACLGFVYAFVVGYVGGRLVASIYNRLIPQG